MADWTFQSTPSAWRETAAEFPTDQHNVHFNPLPPHGGRRDLHRRSDRISSISIHSLRMEGDKEHPDKSAEQNISIHSLRMEGDIVSNYTPVFHVTFQSTPSAWRETAARRQMCQRTDISIHSLRMEGDASFSCNEKLEKDFNPLPPHGGRPLD